MSASPNKVFRVDIRKLPPNLTQNELQLAIKDYADNIVYQYFVPGQFKDKETIFSRAHLNFSSQEKGLEFIEKFKQKFVDKSTNTVYEPVVSKSIYQVALGPNREEPSEEKDFRVGLMYLQFKNHQEQLQKQNESKIDLSQIERKANEDTEEKAKKFEKVKTPILASIEQKKKEERQKKLKEKLNQGTNQVIHFYFQGLFLIRIVLIRCGFPRRTQIIEESLKLIEITIFLNDDQNYCKYL